LARLYAALTLIACLWLGMTGAVQAQTVIERLVAPGQLSAAHIKQEGACKSCHQAFDKTSQKKLCADCHKPVAADIAAHTGFHGKNPQAAQAECRTCHAEHKGRGASLVHMDKASFNHDQTDYPLRGAHVKVACASCHASGAKFRAAPSSCVGCHGKKDPHKGALGSACANCHTESSWKQVKFDHNATHFPLTGAHIKATCASCHADQNFKATPSACVSCHAKKDAHKGSLGPACGNCHSTTAWTPAKFDHARTGFPLVGAHAQADCSDCHAKGRYQDAKPSCVSCHRKDDVHNNKYGVGCADCHNARNWKVVKFDHGRTGFALLGAHDRLVCTACHAGPQSPAKAKAPDKTCISCHAKDDKHKGLNGTDCAQCHTAISWKNATFDHNRQTHFPLSGAHAKLVCAQCHTQPATVVKLATDCASCHRKDDKHDGQLGAACGTCHSDVTWKAPVRFDHDLAPFPLVGKHAGLACDTCHLTKRFKDAAVTCAGCHAKKDPHKGAYKQDCAGCHNPADWKDWAFDHNTTRFVLDGRHANQACASCHKPGRGKVSLTCVSCHQADDVHNGSFGAECQQCHTTKGFAGARASN
jgi:hypothetical protein